MRENKLKTTILIMDGGHKRRKANRFSKASEPKHISVNPRMGGGSISRNKAISGNTEMDDPGDVSDRNDVLRICKEILGRLKKSGAHKTNQGMKIMSELNKLSALLSNKNSDVWPYYAKRWQYIRNLFTDMFVQKDAPVDFDTLKPIVNMWDVAQDYI